MKEKIKKFFASIAAIILAIGMMGANAIPAMADDGVTITINNHHPAGGTENGPDYHWYVMMWASLGSSKEQVSYYVDKESLATALGDITVTVGDAQKKMFSVTRVGTENQWNVTLNNKIEASENNQTVPFSGEEVATALNKIVEGKTGEELAAVTEQSGEISRSTDNSKTFKIDKNGYVLVTSSLGSKLVLDTFNSKEVDEKNTYPTLDKKQSLVDGSNNNNVTYTDNALSTEIGKTIYYSIEITLPNTASKSLKIVDTVTDGLTLNPGVTWRATHGTKGNGSWNEIKPVPSGTPEGSSAYSFEIPAETISSMASSMRNSTTPIESTVITIYYSATVNDKAIKTTPEINKAHLEYDNYITPDDSVEVYTYKFNLYKYDAADAKKALLGDAHFRLYRSDASGNLNEVTVARGEIGKYRVATGSGDEGVARDIVTNSDSQVEISGLDKNATYYLRETQAPAGYNRITGDIRVNYDNDATAGSTAVKLAKADGETPAVPVIQVENHQGSVLPSTGGIGTTIIYVIGGAVVAGAIVLLIARRRKNV